MFDTPESVEARGASGSKATAIDVVILTWNDNGIERLAFDSAHASTGVHAAVVLVDNGSEPPVDDYFLGPEDRIIRLERNEGVARGRNIGARAGTSDLICFLDSDAVLHPNTLSILAEVVRSDPTIALSAPVFDDQDPTDSGGRAPTLGRKLQRVSGRTSAYASGTSHGGVIDVDFAIGACQLVRRDLFEQVGGLDEIFFYGPEDADFCMRLRLAGWRVVQVPAAGCEHPPRRRNRRLLTARGIRHGAAVLRFLWRYRNYRRQVPLP